MSIDIAFKIGLITFALLLSSSRESRAELVFESVRVMAGHTLNASSYTGTSIPALGSLSAQDFPDQRPRPARSTTVDYAFSQSNGVAVFDYTLAGTFAHDFFVGNSLFWTSNYMLLGGGSPSLTSFTVDQASTYEISGGFSASFSGLFPSQLSSTSYYVELREYEQGNFGTWNVLFRHSLSDDLNGMSGSFTRNVAIGQLAGASNELLEGSVSGLLLPGNVYGYYVSYFAWTRNDQGPSGIIGSTAGSFAMTVTALPEPSIAASFVYHGGWTGSGSPQWEALDTTKSLAQLGQTSAPLSLSNLINSSQGLNGVVFDIAGLGNPSSAVWELKWSPQGAFNQNDNPVSSWLPAPGSKITVFPGAGANGSDRVLLQWSNGQIVNRWLSINVTVGSFTATRFVGHLLGETTGQSGGVYTVSFDDISSIRSAVGQSVNAGSIADIDKSGTVSFSDISAVRGNVGAQLTNISIP